MLKQLAMLMFALALVTGAACGGDDTNCKSACDKLSSCTLKSAGLSCDSSCTQGDCAACVTDTSCGDIEAGQCAASCPGVSFSKK